MKISEKSAKFRSGNPKFRENPVGKVLIRKGRFFAFFGIFGIFGIFGVFRVFPGSTIIQRQLRVGGECFTCDVVVYMIVLIGVDGWRKMFERILVATNVC